MDHASDCCWTRPAGSSSSPGQAHPVRLTEREAQELQDLELHPARRSGSSSFGPGKPEQSHRATIDSKGHLRRSD